MAKITAIHGGGDWHDASAVYVVLPEGMDYEAERDAYRRWWAETFYPAYREAMKRDDPNQFPDWGDFIEWLIAHGARFATADEIEVVGEP